ncbi:TetR/AcrR family transcriptional regulator [Lewinella sp. W8]|uniref:TetR/AcrR family transcriptional regulator n=1 Tax=Lewinella sp. W8 TaxID=2528208 RepID=UPI0010682BEE|nr:TetR/AcrR family transcriptional regulator [Lewinella sp. W8]MTB50527.1 TetR family transcriptional regulator [Lewinella sp. W8]
MRLKDEHKLNAIIRATLELTNEKGLAGIRMSDLAKRAGIATGSLYTYFEDKQNLLLSVNRSVRSTAARYLRHQFREEDTLEHRLEHTVKRYVDYVGEHREAILFADLLKRSPYMTEAASQETMDHFQFLLDMVEEGQQSGMIRTGDPEELLHVMDSIVKAMVDFQLFHGRPYTKNIQQRTWGIVRSALIG